MTGVTRRDDQPTEEHTMAPVDLAGIAEPHRSAVTAIIDLARQGMFTDAQALLMIGRIRAVAGELLAREGTP
ncbi:hypothetical protein [Amycolatopsis sp. NPDC051102]|uniref:hypothetical protein n=1 Tax=Amycolatopsis sp. NPDC051102 TaxID=3155163 RepID=UPI00343F812B